MSPSGNFNPLFNSAQKKPIYSYQSVEQAGKYLRENFEKLDQLDGTPDDNKINLQELAKNIKKASAGLDTKQKQLLTEVLEIIKAFPTIGGDNFLSIEETKVWDPMGYGYTPNNSPEGNALGEQVRDKSKQQNPITYYTKIRNKPDAPGFAQQVNSQDGGSVLGDGAYVSPHLQSLLTTLKTPEAVENLLSNNHILAVLAQNDEAFYTDQSSASGTTPEKRFSFNAAKDRYIESLPEKDRAQAKASLDAFSTLLTAAGREADPNEKPITQEDLKDLGKSITKDLKTQNQFKPTVDHAVVLDYLQHKLTELKPAPLTGEVITGTKEDNNLDLTSQTIKDGTTIDLQEGNDIVTIDTNKIEENSASNRAKIVVKGGPGENTLVLTNVDEDVTVKVTQLPTQSYAITFESANFSTPKTIIAEDIDSIKINGQDPKVLEDLAKAQQKSTKFSGENHSYNGDIKDLTSETDLSGQTINLNAGPDHVKISGTTIMNGLIINGGSEEDSVHITDVSTDYPVEVRKTKNTDEYTVSFTNTKGQARSFVTKDIESLKINEDNTRSIKDFETITTNMILGRNEPSNPDRINLSPETLLQKDVYLRDGGDEVTINGTKLAKNNESTLNGGQGNDTLRLNNIDERSLRRKDIDNETIQLTFNDSYGTSKSLTLKSIENISINGNPAQDIATVNTPESFYTKIKYTDKPGNPDHVTFTTEDMAGKEHYLQAGDDKAIIDGNLVKGSIPNPQDPIVNYSFSIHGGTGQDQVDLTNVDETSPFKVEENSHNMATVSFVNKKGDQAYFEINPADVEFLTINGKQPLKVRDLIAQSKTTIQVDGATSGDFKAQGAPSLQGKTIKGYKADDHFVLSATQDMPTLIDGGSGTNNINLKDVELVHTVRKNANGDYTITFTDDITSGSSKTLQVKNINEIAMDDRSMTPEQWITETNIQTITPRSNRTIKLPESGYPGTFTVSGQDVNAANNLLLEGHPAQKGEVVLDKIVQGSLKIKRDSAQQNQGPYTVEFTDTNGQSKTLKINHINQLTVDAGTTTPEKKSVEEWVAQTRRSDLSNSKINLADNPELRIINGSLPMNGLAITGDGSHSSITLNNMNPGSLQVTKGTNGTYTIKFTEIGKTTPRKEFSVSKINSLTTPEGTQTLDAWIRGNNITDLSTTPSLSNNRYTLPELSLGGKFIVSGKVAMQNPQFFSPSPEENVTLTLKDIDPGSIKVQKQGDHNYLVTFKDTSNPPQEKRFNTLYVDTLALDTGSGAPISKTLEEWVTASPQ